MLTESVLIGLLMTIPTWAGLENSIVLDQAQDVQHVSKIQETKAAAKEESTGPTKTSNSLGIKVTAESALVVDRDSKQVLFSKNPDDVRAMASITKVMTAIVALESAKDLEATVTIDPELTRLEGGKIKLLSGEEITLYDLICGALIASGNDAASAVGKYVGGGDMDVFVEMMNTKAKEIGMNHTQFRNPSGLDEDGQITSTRDLAIMFDYALKNEKFREIIGMRHAEAHALNVDKIHYFNNTNKLLRDTYSYMKGGKTGFTDNAGFCLISVSGHSAQDEIITVVLGSDLSGNQFQDSKALIEWTYDNFEWK
ncbi:D-alanyl-D-alanine carboxypeptidase [Patescibacteria group bacterium]|nr:D-alanyl-D-alanine carboxypeptidase [Patescibacteria group bacterium]